MKRSFRIVFAVIFVLLFALTLVGCKEVKVGINFVVDNQIYHTINTKGEEAIELPKAPQKEGYVFQGWFWDKDVWRQPFTINSLLNQPLEEMVDVYAYFITVEEAESNKTVTFNTMGGGTTPSQTVKKGSAVTEPEGVTKTGYILVGWYREADYTTKWDFVADRVQEDLTLYAKWVPESDMAGAEIIEAGDFAVEGKTLSIRTPNADQTFSFSEQIQVSPYAVYKICTDRACTQEIPSGIVDLQVGSNTFYIMITSGNGSNKTVYTAEIYRRHMFSVTYRYNNGTADKVIEAEEDSLLSPEDPGSKTGYDFVGWSDWDFESDVVSGSMTLDAVWEEAVYKISFQTEGGSEINPTEVRYQSDYQWSVPEKRGYDFLGWKDGDTMLTDAVGQSLAAWTKAQDTTVTAAWEAIEYTIDYANLKGADNPNPTAYTIEDEVTFAPVAQAGYRFEAWHDEEGTVIDGIARGSIGNRTVEAVWEILEYTATFVIEGEEVATRTFTVETESIEEPAIPEKIGYTRAWEPYAFVADDITIHAVYTPIVYNIVYMVSGAYDVDTPVNTNPTSYTIEDETITFAPASKTGYTFVKWTKDGEDITEIASGSYGDITVTAVWEVVVYNIEYIDAPVNSNVTSYTVETETFVLATPEKTGYDFVNWTENGTETTEIPQGSYGDKTITANWNVHVYTITYTGVSGAYDVDTPVNTNPTSYTIEDETIMFAPASKTGYTFVKWTKDGEDITEIASGSYGDITVTAVWEVVVYNIEYIDAPVNSNVTSYTVETETYVLATPERTGYDFVNWTENGTETTEIPQGSYGDKTITANWNVHVYTITYTGVSGAYDVDTPVNTNPTSYTIEDEAITFAPASKTGYTFVKWTKDGEDITEIASGSYGDITVTAVWEVVVYNIEYIDAPVNSNVTSYTVETETFVLATPEKTGYDFVNWTENGTETTEIPQGSYGDKTITANWNVHVYTITYTGVSGAYDVDTPVNTNPTSYTIEDETIMFAPASKTGYTFVKWTKDGEDITEIASGSYGDITVTAVWQTVSYTLDMVMENEEGGYDGHYEDEENRTSFTVEDEFLFIEPVCDIRGYEFKGWYTLKNDGDKVEGIALGTVGNKIYYARWQRTEYTITYYNIDESVNSNPASYNVESDTFTLVDPTKTGYTFVGWYSDAELSLVADTTVETDSIGNLSFYAKWTPTAYTVTYVLYDGVNSEDNPSSYTIEDEITFSAPTKDGYSFGGWFADSAFENGIDKITLGSTGNMTLYAKWYYTGTVTFETNGGTTIDPITQEYGTVLVAPEDPARQHYTFAGWYSDEALQNEYVFDTMPDFDFTLYAKWDAVEYKITYVLNGGENGDNPDVYTVESAFDFAGATKIGYRFVAWYTQPDFTGEPVASIAAGTFGDMTLYANYAINSYTISFDSAGGSAVTPITQEYDTAVSAPAAPSKNGYRFNGWLTEESELFVFDRIPAYDITLTADWELIRYTITYNLGGGVNDPSNPAYYTIEDDTVTFAAPTRRGYTFKGWFADSDYTETITSIPAGSYGVVDIEAKWEIIVYDIIYVNVDGLENPNPATYTVEDDITFAEVFRLGHTFGGFFKEADFVTPVEGVEQGSIGDITLYAKHTVNTYNVWLDGKEAADYTVSFDLNGGDGSIAPQQITASVALAYPEVPVRGGYLFGGWYQTEDCTGNAYDFAAEVRSDLTLFAKWVAVGNPTMAINSTMSVAVNGTALHYYDFVPLVSGYVSMTTTGSVDTFGYLYDHAGDLLASNDDGSDGGNFLIKYNVTAGEKYTVAFRGYGKTSIGESVLHLSGNNTVADGGAAVEAGEMQPITFGTAFTLPVPEARSGYVFRGWADEDGVMYTDETGASVRNFDKGEETILYSFWEVDGFDLIFVTNGGSSVDTVTIVHGGRVDINNYVTTRSGYTFLGWYLSAGDSEPYNASVMPDHDVTLYAKWTAYALDPIKYDESIKAATSLRAVTADDFGATCFDNGGNQVPIAVTLTTQTAGETAIVRLTATSNGKTRTATIQNVRIYGEPTLTFDDGVTYFNLKDGLTADWFTASGTDTYGEATEIQFEIEGDYAAGDVVTVIVKSVDPAGNVTSGSVANVKVYGLPVITYNEEKGEISVNDVLSAELLGATAVDSFDESLNVSVTLSSGTIAAGNTVTLTLTATDKYGNTTVINKDFAVYGMPTISDAETLEFRVEDEITPESLGITARDTYDAALEISLAVKEGAQSAGVTMIWTATVTDIAGNVTTKDYSVRIYGTPVITYDRDTVKVTEDATVVNGAEKYLNAYAYDSFGNKLTVTASVSSGELAGGGHIAYTLTAVDHLGNTGTITTAAIPVYDVADIVLDYDAFSTNSIKLTSKGEEFAASATDTFGEACVITVERAGGGAIVVGEVQDIVIVATDRAGNRYVSETVSGIKVYGMPTAALTYPDNGYTVSENDDISFLFIVRDSFGEEIYAEITSDAPLVAGNTVNITVTATDDAGNVFEGTYLFGVLPAEDPFVTLMVSDALWQSLFVTDNVLPLPTVPDDGMVFYGWFDGNGTRFTDEAGNLLVTPDEYVVLYAGIYPEGYTPISTAEELKNISLDGKYILLNDIDLGGAEWTPIGTSSSPFTGEFDGNGYTVSNFKITTGRQYVGLFGYNKGVIENLGVENFTVNVSYGSTVYAGGLVGYNSGSITNSYATGKVSATASYSNSKAYAGGLVGYNDGGSITNSYAACEVSATASSSNSRAYAGGLVGYNDGGSITNSYATGDVSATADRSAYAGGLVGRNSGSILNSYATGDVSASSASDAYAGGLVGYNDGGSITNCYRYSGQTFYRKQGSYTYSTANNTLGTAVSLDNLKSPSWVNENLWTAETEIWDFSNGYPTLDYEYIDSAIITISTAEELERLQGQTLVLSYELNADIDLGGMKWTPVAIFCGTFNGNGYTVSNFKITTGRKYVGLFGYNKGVIENLGVENFTVNVSYSDDVYAGGLVGYNGGSITNSYATGEVSATSSYSYAYAGGLVGYNDYGSITNSYATGEVSATSYDSYAYAGGLVGYNDYGSITNSYAACEVSATASSSNSRAYAGGLVGYNDGGSILNCYATGDVRATADRSAYAGGLVGYNSGGIILNCYATGDVSASSDSSAYAYAGGLVGYNNSGDITNCYRYSGQTFYRKQGSTTYSTASNTLGTPVSLENLKSPSWVYENLWTAETEIWDFSNGYPTLDYEYIDSANTIVISTAEELKKLQGQALVLSYELNADIDLGGMEWTPVAIFYGTFNGNGYTVSNFKITTGRRYVGLFGYNKGVIENLGVENFTVNVSYGSTVYAGGLVGRNSGSITNSYATGDVSATADDFASAGGLVGSNSGDITNSYATGNVSATSTRSDADAGGLVGSNSGDITNSYATGDVSATATPYSAAAGGLVGYNNSGGSITNCYRYSGQTFYRKEGSDTYSTASNTLGTEEDLTTLQSVSFHTSTLGWDESVWNCVDGAFPSLKNVSSTIGA